MGAGGGLGVQGHPELQTALKTSLSYLKPGLKAPENEKGGGGGRNPIAIKPQKVIKSQQQQQNNSAANWEGIRVETSQQKRQSWQQACDILAHCSVAPVWGNAVQTHLRGRHGGRERLYEQVSARIWRNWSLTVRVDVVSSHINETQTRPTGPAVQPSTVHIQPKEFKAEEKLYGVSAQRSIIQPSTEDLTTQRCD